MGSQQMLAAQHVALRNRIEKMNDPEILSLLEESWANDMNIEMTREIHQEWAEMARLIAKKDEGECQCDVCAISHALRWASTLMKAGPQ